MRHEITAVDRGSAAHRAGILPGDVLLRINGEDIIDEIDYQALIANRQLEMELERDGKPLHLSVRKYEVEPMGLHFGESMTLSPRTCYNNCAFCFIAQMPPGLRKTLYVKDDDWRFSLMMGNFVTLTNVNDQEFERIIRRHASPLYISVHTTDPELRCRLMNNRFAGNIMERLTRLKEAGIHFHCQIVVCPEQNDGEALMRTLNDLRSLAPAAETAALVPVGLTKFREGLFPLRTFTREEARALLKMIALPLSKAVVSVIALWTAVGQWNCYFNALIYIRDENLYPLALIMRNILVTQQIQSALGTGEAALIALRKANLMRSAMIIVATVPIMCVYPFVQKYFDQGVMIGAVKG